MGIWKAGLMATALLASIIGLGRDGYAVIVVPSITRSSEVTTVVTPNSDGTWTYNYTVINTSPGPQTDQNVWPLIVDFEVPLDSPNVVWTILSPEIWSYEFISASAYIDRFGEANPFNAPWILHWFDTDPPDGTIGPDMPSRAIAPDGYTQWVQDNFEITPDVYEPSTDGFIFTSSMSPVNGPYLTSWVDQERNIGDPPLPGGGPVGGGGTPSFTPVPEPFSFAIWSLLAICGIQFGWRHRKRA